MSDYPPELNLAIEHYTARRFADAEATCRNILAGHGHHPRVLHVCAAAVAQQRRLLEAIELLISATKADPNFFEAWDDLARLYDVMKNPPQSAAALERAAALRPDDVELLIRWSGALLQCDRPAAAETVARRALGIKPELAAAFFHLGCALEQQSRLDEAIDSYRRSAELDPRFAVAYVNLGAALYKHGQAEQAAQALERAIQLDPNSALALSNRSMLLAEFDRLDEAEAAARKAVELQPGNATFAANLSTVLCRLHRYEEALRPVQRAVTLEPQNHLAHTGLAIVLLMLGRWREAWPEWEWRSRGWDVPPTGRTMWDGSPLNGRSIVVRAEQGFGDTIQCLRYIPLLKSRGGAGKVSIECQGPLKDLVRSVPGLDEVHVKQDSIASGDVEVWLMSLPRWFDTMPDSIPQNVPYLRANPERMETLRPFVSATPGMKVGLVWAGSPTHASDHQRSCPAEQLAPLTKIAGVSCFSLQRGAAQQRDAHLIAELGLIDLAKHFNDISDLAAAMMLLDLIVTVDTSASHLAGALARPVWTLLSTMPEWRYPRDGGEQSAWYPTMRLFRQSTPGQWSDVIEAIARRLQDQLATAAGKDRR